MYLGCFPNLHLAAFYYDLAMIQIKGPKAKTNYDYNSVQVFSIFQSPSVI